MERWPRTPRSRKAAGTILPRIVGQDRPEHDVKRDDSTTQFDQRRYRHARQDAGCRLRSTFVGFLALRLKRGSREPSEVRLKPDTTYTFCDHQLPPSFGVPGCGRLRKRQYDAKRGNRVKLVLAASSVHTFSMLRIT
jgi:hypothetical protein